MTRYTLIDVKEHFSLLLLITFLFVQQTLRLLIPQLQRQNVMNLRQDRTKPEAFERHDILEAFDIVSDEPVLN